MAFKLPSIGGIEITTVAVAVAVVSIVVYELVQQAPNAAQIKSFLLIPDPSDTTGDPNSPGDTSEANLASMGAFGWVCNVINKVGFGIPQSLVNEMYGDPWKPGDTGDTGS